MFTNTGSVYRHLCDEKSRFLYEKRCMYSLTGDEKYTDDIVASLIDGDKASDLIRKAHEVSDRLVIRGVGNEYWALKRFDPKLQFVCFTDRDPWKIKKGEIDAHKVVTPEEFYESYGDYYVLVTSSAFHKEIVKELREHGIPDEKILDFGALCGYAEQYFEPGIVSPIDHEIFVDGGCYDGTTIRHFARWCNNSHDKIYSFEPDRHNYEMTLKSLQNDPVRAVTVLNKGLWDKDETLFFHESGGQGSSITEGKEGAVSIEVTSIDQVVKRDRVTFIKLDVEGVEYEALKGAEKTIRSCHPRMAISIYHKPEDIFTLPELVLSMSDDYRFYLRHYQMSRFETILYAV